MYQSIYNLLVNHIFNGDISNIAYGEFFCSGISIVACGLLTLLPFFILWRIIKKFL